MLMWMIFLTVASFIAGYATTASVRRNCICIGPTERPAAFATVRRRRSSSLFRSIHLRTVSNETASTDRAVKVKIATIPLGDIVQRCSRFCLRSAAGKRCHCGATLACRAGPQATQARPGSSGEVCFPSRSNLWFSTQESLHCIMANTVFRRWRLLSALSRQLKFGCRTVHPDPPPTKCQCSTTCCKNLQTE